MHESHGRKRAAQIGSHKVRRVLNPGQDPDFLFLSILFEDLPLLYFLSIF